MSAASGGDAVERHANLMGGIVLMQVALNGRSQCTSGLFTRVWLPVEQV